MAELTDHELLAEFARSESEAAFAELVARYVNLVYSAALRFTGNSHHAEEVTQVVFIILARKAGNLSPRVVLSGWLYQAARLTAANFMKGEMRRQRREQEAYMQSTLNEPAAAAWEQIAPLLEDAMGRLGNADRNAIVLRFFQNKTATEIASALNLSEATAHKRTNRALEKLRRFFAKHGVSSTSAIIAGTISANSVQAAPVLLAKSVTAMAITKGAASSASTLTLIKGALKIMAWTKAKTAIVVSAGILLTAGTTTVVVKKIEAYNAYRDSWRVPNLNSYLVAQAAPQVRILPAKFPAPQDTIWRTVDSLKWGGIGVRVADIVWAAYSWRPGRIVFPAGQPPERYDFISTLPQGSAQALQRELKEKLGFVGRRETRDVDVLVLKVRRPNASGLKPPIVGIGDDWGGSGRYVCGDQPLSTELPAAAHGLTKFLELYFGIPVIDQTGLTQHFNIDLKWNERGRQDPNHDAVKNAILDQLGLELVPGHEPVEMLVIERAKN